LSAITTGLGHRIYRGNRNYGFWEAEARQLEAGDLIVEVVPRS
jgi:voltage-gated potassium channel